MRNDKNIFTPVGGRRFVLTLGCGIVNTLLVIFEVITGDIYQMIIIGTVGAYIAGAAVQKTWGTYNQYPNGSGHGQQY